MSAFAALIAAPGCWVGSSILRRIGAKCSGTPSAMMSAYVGRSPRPSALNTAGPSAGASVFWFSSLIPIGNASKAPIDEQGTVSGAALTRKQRDGGAMTSLDIRHQGRPAPQFAENSERKDFTWTEAGRNQARH